MIAGQIWQSLPPPARDTLNLQSLVKYRLQPQKGNDTFREQTVEHTGGSNPTDIQMFVFTISFFGEWQETRHSWRANKTNIDGHNFWT